MNVPECFVDPASFDIEGKGACWRKTENGGRQTSPTQRRAAACGSRPEYRREEADTSPSRTTFCHTQDWSQLSTFGYNDFDLLFKFNSPGPEMDAKNKLAKYVFEFCAASWAIGFIVRKSANLIPTQIFHLNLTKLSKNSSFGDDF
jgi:hypothetical protein